MALIHPTDNQASASHKETTKHPGVCLAGFFALLVGAALGVHMLFGMLT